jgi:glycosyltransferase involved in cell wall biosynthesis
MSEPRFLLLTSSDTGHEAVARLSGLFASIERQGVEGDHVLVLRGEGTPDLPPSDRFRVHTVYVPFDTSLAVARNMAIRHARDLGLLDQADVVGFPDDDCEYAAGALQQAAHLLGGGEALVCVPYAPSTTAINRRRFPDLDTPITPTLAMQAGSCVGIFLPGWAVNAIGDFDERYGLGAHFGAAEDTDYVLRAFSSGLTCRYRGRDALVLHAYKSSRPAQYYLGNLAALAKHAHTGRTRYLLMRRVVFGALLVTFRRMRWRDYFHALRAAFDLLGSDPAAELPLASPAAAPTGRSAPSPRTSARGL